MNPLKMRFQNVDPNKIPVCFTFDDNFSRHSDIMAPAFIQRGFRCTFYINPGAGGFGSHLPQYAALLSQGFEIGSHGYVHDNLSQLTLAAASENLRQAAQAIEKSFGVYPATFAFPYHDYTDETLRTARSYHIETRNTLLNSIWFAIKTAIPLGDMLTAVEQGIAEKRPLVFSGHSVIVTPEEAQDESLKAETGYNPILLSELNALLDFIKWHSEHVQVFTFEQAALLAYIRQHGEIDGDAFSLTPEALGSLKTYGIDAQKLSKMI